MPYSDWEITKTDSGLLAVLDIISPLKDVGSLRIDNSDIMASVDRCMASARLTSAHQRGVTKGRARTLVHFKTASYSSNGECGIGLYCMQNQADIMASGGAAYMFTLSSYSPNHRWRLGKCTNGITGYFDVTSLAAEIMTFTPVTGTTYAMELEWVYDAVELGGTLLVARAGEADDFSDLQEIYKLTDTSSPLTTSIGEGLCYIDYETLNFQRDAYFDDSTIFAL